MQTRAALSDRLRVDSLGIAVGETSRAIPCPYCGEADSFSVTRTGSGLLYHCWRASCEARGFVGSKGYELSTKIGEKSKARLKPYMKPLRRLTGRMVAWLGTSYGLTSDDIANNGFRYSPTDNRLVMPIRTIEGYEAGKVAKRMPDGFATDKADLTNKKKSIIYWESECVKLDFPYEPGRVGNICVVVEDKLSAVRLQPFIQAVSLCGSHMSDEQAGFLATNFRTLVHATDADTWQNKAKAPLGIRHMQKYGIYFDRFIVRYITKDPKDMTDKEILEQIIGDLG